MPDSIIRRPFGRVSGETDLNDYLSDTFLARVRNAYRRCSSPDKIDGDSAWEGIGQIQASVHDALLETDNTAIRRIFANPGLTDLFYGVDNLCQSLMAPLAAGLEQANLAARQQTEGDIRRLAEAVGVRRWLPPDSEFAHLHGAAGGDSSPDVEDLLSRLDRKLGLTIDFPTPFSGEIGLPTSRGLATYRSVQALYQAFRVFQEVAPGGGAVLEIGAGMGRTIYYLRQMGFTELATIDLPLGVVRQACFLGAVLTPDELWMVGDDPACAAGRICLLPSTLPFRSDHVRLALNADSLVEMGFEVSARYAEWISDHADIFLSINHEVAGPRVADLADRYFADAHARRAPYWLRRGYVEEVYRFRR